MEKELANFLENIENRLMNEMKEVKKITIKTNMKIEHDIEPKVKSLFDGNKQLNDKIDRIENQVNLIDKKIDNQEVEIKVLKAVK